MTWTLFNLQLLLTQPRQDLWISAPTGASFKDLTTLVSQLWLQGAFYNLTPDEIDFFTLILYIILHPDEHCSSSDSNNFGLSAPHPDWPLPVSLTITALLILILAIGLVTVSPQDRPPILRLSVGTAYVASCLLLLGRCFFCTA